MFRCALWAALAALACAQPWPPCPLRGCLPCPDFSDGRPNCTCLEGFSLNGSSAGGVALEWDTVQGWIGSCEAVICGQLEGPAQAEELQENGAAIKVFPDTVEYLCRRGYEVEGYGSDSWTFIQEPSVTSAPPAKLMRFRCSAEGTFENLTGQRCVPVCGDGLLVPTDHLPENDREQCDDGNRNKGDGCDGQCRVETGFICVGGTPTQPDRCTTATIWASSSIIVSMTGARAASIEEVGLATSIVLAEVFQCPQRDLEVLEVSSANAPLVGAGSQLHSTRQAMQVRFRIKISDPQVLSLDHIEAEMANPRLFMPKLVAAFLQNSSLQDLYIMVVEVQPPTFQGKEAKVVGMDFNDYVVLVAAIGASLATYVCLIGVVTPTIYWCLFITKRPHRLRGHLQHIPEEHKTGWIFGICDCCRSKVTCCSLLCFLPARLAYTWDTVGILPYWRGVRQGLLCCGLYLMGCWPCGAFVAGNRRSDLKDFLGFGDGVKSNIEVEDVCSYLLCPVCSVVQEAAHVDKVFAAVQSAVKEEAEKARRKLEDHNEDDEEQPAEAPTLQAMLDEGFNAALDTAVMALD